MKTLFINKTIKAICIMLAISSNFACATTTSDNQQQYSSYKSCAHVSPSKVAKCIK